MFVFIMLNVEMKYGLKIWTHKIKSTKVLFFCQNKLCIFTTQIKDKNYENIRND